MKKNFRRCMSQPISRMPRMIPARSSLRLKGEEGAACSFSSLCSRVSLSVVGCCSHEGGFPIAVTTLFVCLRQPQCRRGHLHTPGRVGDWKYPLLALFLFPRWEGASRECVWAGKNFEKRKNKINRMAFSIGWNVLSLKWNRVIFLLMMLR